MATTTLMSFAEFERLDEGSDDLELLKGELVRMPMPKYAHMDTCQRLFELLKSAVADLRQENPGLNPGKVHIEMGYRFPGEPGSGLKPDVSLTHPAQPIDRFYIGAPLIAFEVVSESERAVRLNEKVLEYLANGAAETRSIHTSLLPGIDIPLGEIL